MISGLVERGHFSKAIHILSQESLPETLAAFYDFVGEEDLMEKRPERPRVSAASLKRILHSLGRAQLSPWEKRALKSYALLCGGKYEEAQSAAREAFKARPDHAPTALLFASSLWMRGNLWFTAGASRTWLIETRRMAERAVALGAGNEGLMLRANVRLALEDNEGASEDLKLCLKKSPENARARIWLAEAFLELRRYREALEQIRKAAAAQPEWWVIAQRGHVRGLQGDHATALKDFDEAILKKGGQGSLYAWKAEVLRKMGRYQESLKSLDQGIALAPRYIFSRVCRGRLKLMLGRPEEALEDLEEAARIKPSDRLAFVWRAEARFKLGRWRSAWEDFEYTMPLDPSSTWNAVVREGEIPSRPGRQRAFWKCLDDGVQKNPKEALVWLIRGRFKAYKGLGPEALLDLTRARQVAAQDKDKAAALGWRGWALWRMGALEKSLADLEASLGLHPSAVFMAAKAQVLLELGRAGSENAYAAALKNPEPFLAPFYINRARLLVKRRQWRDAHRDFEAAFLMDASFDHAREGLVKMEKKLGLKAWLPLGNS